MTDQAPLAGATARPPLVLWGFAPLLVGLVVAVIVVLSAPSVAPEVVVVRPGDAVTTTATSSEVSP